MRPESQQTACGKRTFPRTGCLPAPRTMQRGEACGEEKPFPHTGFAQQRRTQSTHTTKREDRTHNERERMKKEEKTEEKGEGKRRREEERKKGGRGPQTTANGNGRVGVVPQKPAPRWGASA